MKAPLLERQRALPDEAAAVLEDLELLPLLRTVGDAIKVGSMAPGLMVARDIDLTILCPELDPTRVFRRSRRFVASRVRGLRFRNDTGRWNEDPNSPDGVRGTGLRDRAGEDWSLDLSFIHERRRRGPISSTSWCCRRD